MTTKVLSDIRFLKQELARLDHDISHFEPQTRSSQAASELVQLLRDIRTKRERELAEIERFIQSIKDPIVKRIFTLRFVEGKKWDEVSYGMLEYGYYSADNARQTVYRYLKKAEKNH